MALLSGLLLSFHSRGEALEGVVTVLETALFSGRDLGQPIDDRPVVERKRRGEKVTLHPFYLREEQFREQQTRDFSFEEYERRYPDQFLAVDEKIYAEELLDPQYYVVLDSRGRKAFIKRSHIYVYFKTPREFDQTVHNLKTDPTDYRLPEPLRPETYPFVALEKKQTYMGHLLLGAGTSSTKSYPYELSGVDEQRKAKFHGQLAWHKAPAWSKEGNFLWGAAVAFESWNQEYRFEGTDRFARESWLELSIGPSFYYNPILENRYRLGILTQFYLPLIMQNEISQTDSSGLGDVRKFKTWAPSAHLGVLFEIKEAIGILDFAIGPSIKVRLPSQVNSDESAVVPSFWNDQPYEQSLSVEISFLAGLQARM